MFLLLPILLIAFFLVLEHDGYRHNPDASRWYQEDLLTFLKRFEF
jgi:hypothetical protein